MMGTTTRILRGSVWIEFARAYILGIFEAGSRLDNIVTVISSCLQSSVLITSEELWKVPPPLRKRDSFYRFAV